jgi:hypothetical protein
VKIKREKIKENIFNQEKQLPFYNKIELNQTKRKILKLERTF